MEKKIIRNIFFLSLLLLMFNSQISIHDKETIERYILQGQSKNTGLFFENSHPFKHTKEAIASLKILGLDIKHKKEICLKLSEIKDIDVNIISIDNLLECKIKFKNYKPDLSKAKLVELYNEGKILDMLNINKWDELYKKLKNFLIQENGKFSLLKNNEKKKKSLIATAIGVELLILIANKNPSLKNELFPFLQKSIYSIMKMTTEISENMIVFIEKNIGIYKLNFHVIKAIKEAKKFGIEIELLNNKLYKLLNYFNTFKYKMISDIDNTYYLLNIYKLLERTPLMKINTDSFNYLKDKNIKINFVNIFGENLEIKNSTIKISVDEDTTKNPKTGNQRTEKKKSAYDLDDDNSEEDNKSQVNLKKEIQVLKPKNFIEFDLSQMIKNPGYFTLSVNMENKNYGLRENKKKNYQKLFRNKNKFN